jgi:hypothetical protein
MIDYEKLFAASETGAVGAPGAIIPETGSISKIEALVPLALAFFPLSFGG